MEGRVPGAPPGGRRVGGRAVVVSLLTFVALLATPSAIAISPGWLTFPSDQVVEATSSSGAVVTWTNPTTVAPGLDVDCAPESGTTFQIGTWTVTCTATDNQVAVPVVVLSDSFTVTVEDTTPPTVNVPGNITTPATSPSGAVVTFSVSASDAVDPSPSVSCAPPSGSTFPVGTTTVNCTATDAHGNAGSGSFSVTIQDTTPPVLTVPGNMTVPATGPGGAVVTYTASAVDAIDPTPTVVCAPPSGSTFPLGTTTVNCTATDDSGNSSSGSFTITVKDSTPPTLTVPGDMTAEATGPGGAVVTYAATASDGVDPNPSVSCAPPSGSTFPITTTTVSCTASDSSGNTSAPKTFTITVRDTTPPTVTVPGDITQEASGPNGASVSFSASASDIVSGNITPTCTPGSGSVFPIATTNVTCTATDGKGNGASATFRVTVRDTTAPVFSQVPVGPVVEADGPGGSRVTYTPPIAVDLVNGPVLVSCTPAPGSIFPRGTTTVTCSAKDARGNTAAASFPVKVVDTTKPALNVPQPQDVSSNGAQTLSRDDAQVQTFLASAQAKDVVDGNLPVKNDAPAVLPLGKTRITFTATDSSGNTATAQVELNVVTGAVSPTKQDTTPPKDVTRLKAKPGDRFVMLTWVKPTTDFDHLRISRSPGKNGAPATVVYSGAGTQLKDAKLTNGVEYRYVLVAYDKAGNFSPGIAARATPIRPLLYAPAAGEAVTKPPQLRWAGVAGATYYNVQVYRARLAKIIQPGVKILSAWPKRPQLALARTWKFNGKTQRLTAGTYVWFAWPGLGPKAQNRYGPVLGQSTFVVKPS